MGAQYIHNHSNYYYTDAPYTPVFDYDTNEIIRSLQSEGTADLTPAFHSLNYNNEVAIDTTGRKIILNLEVTIHYMVSNIGLWLIGIKKKKIFEK